MNDNEFKKLQNDLWIAMDKVDELQKKYRKETGKDFVRPLFLADRIADGDNDIQTLPYNTICDGECTGCSGC